MRLRRTGTQLYLLLRTETRLAQRIRQLFGN